MEKTQIQSIMTKNVVCTSKKTKLSEIVRTMRDRSFSCMVITEGKKPIGIITERDLVRVFADSLENKADQVQYASDIMSSPPITLHEDKTVINAIAIARAQTIRHLIVVNAKDELAGVVTQSDLFRIYFHSMQRKDKEQSLKEQKPTKKKVVKTTAKKKKR